MTVLQLMQVICFEIKSESTRFVEEKDESVLYGTRSTRGGFSNYRGWMALTKYAAKIRKHQ